MSAAENSGLQGNRTLQFSYNLPGFFRQWSDYICLESSANEPLPKNLTLRKTKTDRVDARMTASMLLSDVGLKPYTCTAYHNEELKSLTRYRFDKVQERAKLKSSVSRLVCILFPELEKLVPSLHIASVYTLLEEFPGVVTSGIWRSGFGCRQKLRWLQNACHVSGTAAHHLANPGIRRRGC